MAGWKESLSIASSTLIVGTVVYLIAPNSAPFGTLLGGAVGATGTNLIWSTKRQKERKQQSESSLNSAENSLPFTEILSNEKPFKIHQASSDSPFSNNPLSESSTQISPRNFLDSEDTVLVPNPIEEIDAEEIDRSSTQESLSELAESEQHTTSNTVVPTNTTAPPEILQPDALPADSAKPVDESIESSTIYETALPPNTPAASPEKNSLNSEKENHAGSSDQKNESGHSHETDHQDHPVVVKLHQLGITVNAYTEPRPSDVLFDQSALMLGDHYQDLAHCSNVFFGKYRKFIDLSKQFQRGELSREPNNALFYRFNPDEPVQNRTLCYDFFSLLKQNTLIRDVKWSHRDEDLLIVIFQKKLDQSVLNFINGFWLERYVYQKIKQVLVRNEQAFSYLRNVKIWSPDTNRENELDVLFLIEGELLWCECTTGRQYSKNIEKYSHHLQKLLALPPERTFLVLKSPIIDENIALGISDKWGITVANEANLVTKLQSALR